MSEENVEVVRRVFDANNRRDVEATWAVVDPEIEWDTRDIPFPDLAGVCRGLEELIRWWGRWFAAWEEMRFEIEGTIDAGDDVVVATRAVGKGREGIELEVSFFNVMTVREGKLVRNRVYQKRSKALEAVGLSE